MKNRRQFTKDFKAKVAIEAIKGQRTANELAREFNGKRLINPIFTKPEIAVIMSNQAEKEADYGSEGKRADKGRERAVLEGSCRKVYTKRV